MTYVPIFVAISVALMFSSHGTAAQEGRDRDDPQRQRADADALLAKVRGVLPKGWEATLYWSREDLKKSPALFPANWPEDRWRTWLPGMDGRRIEIRRKEVVRFQERIYRSDREGTLLRTEEVYPRFALTLGDARQEGDVQMRLSDLDDKIKPLEAVLTPSCYYQYEDGYIWHRLPPDDEGRRTLKEYEKLWEIKRCFPQWSEGSLSAGFRSLIWLRRLPDEAKAEYRQVKKTVLGTLRPIHGWKYISANEE